MHNMSKTKRLVVILSTTLVLSLVGILCYVSANPASAHMYYGRMNYGPHAEDSNKDSKGFGWLDFIPFIDDEVKDYVNDEINSAISKGLSEAERATDEAASAINKAKDDWHNGWNNSSWNWNFGSDYKKYDTIEDTITNTFSTKGITEVSIDSDTSKLVFIEEKRDDIQVEYEYTKPDTSKYEIDYSAKNKNNALVITQNIKTKGFSSGLQHYKNNITIRVPKDFTVTDIYYRNSLGRITSSDFFSKAKNITLIASLGEVDFSLNKHASIDKLDIQANNGEIALENEGTIKDLGIEANLGSIEIDSDGSVSKVSIGADLGSVDATFKKALDGIKATCHLGSLHLTLYDNDDTVFDATVSMGKVTSDFTKGDNDDFKLINNMGDIVIKKK